MTPPSGLPSLPPSNGQPAPSGPPPTILGVPAFATRPSNLTGGPRPTMAPNASHPDDSHNAERLRLPDDPPTRAAGVATAGGSSVAAGESRAGSKAPQELEAILARVVVEQGLATMDEVQGCLRKQRELDAAAISKAAGASGDPGQSPGGSALGKAHHTSLGALLVEAGSVTKKQLERVRLQVDAEGSGQRIPGYVVLGKLGAGAMATVFKARQVSLDRLVAIKILPRKFSSDPQFIERFNAEGRSAAQMNHPNIVQAFDVGKAGEYHYFVMEYVEGSTVYDQIVRQKRYSEKEAIEIIIQVAQALEHAHQRGLIHRDVKPKNVMINSTGVVKLADMGLARAISDREAAEQEAGKAFGTPYYISPEQIRGELDVGPPADIYSLGATMYHMVTGRVPFEGKDPAEVMKKHLKMAAVPPDHINPKLSNAVSEVIEMMMAKNKQDRYQNCTDLLTDLRALQRGEKPIIAHKSIAAAPAADLSRVLQEEAARPAEIARDKTRAPSPFSHLIVQIMLAALILSVVGNVILMATK